MRSLLFRGGHVARCSPCSYLSTWNLALRPLLTPPPPPPPPPGRTRISRLLHIARNSPSLRIPASSHAISLLKSSTSDPNSYQSAFTLRNTDAEGNLIRADQRAEPDPEWTRETIARVKSEGEKLELELRNYQNNLIKESIRVCFSVRPLRGSWWGELL